MNPEPLTAYDRKGDEVEDQLRSYRDHVPNAYALFIFLADIDQRLGCVERLTVRELTEEQLVHAVEAHQLFVFLDSLGLGRYSRKRERFTFDFDPMWIGWLALTDDERKEYDEYYG
jgi:hypothetical protein